MITPEQHMIAREMRGQFNAALASLKYQQAVPILRERFGLDSKPKTLRELSEQHGLSRSRIDQIVKRGLRMMRARLGKDFHDPVRSRKRDLMEEALTEARRTINAQRKADRDRARFAQEKPSFVVVKERDTRQHGTSVSVGSLVFGAPAGSKAPPSWYLNGRWLLG
jgi:hypothetical protein